MRNRRNVHGKRPLVICTDPGIDDFIALSMVLSRPEFDVLGMVALSGNVGLDVTVNNALLACEYNARADIPVLAGSAKPLVRPARSASNIHGKSGLGASLDLYARERHPIKTARISSSKWRGNTRGSLKFSRWGP
ncbi:MAG: nucleoside hydrolase [Oscillospiraceae bacterium]